MLFMSFFDQSRAFCEDVPRILVLTISGFGRHLGLAGWLAGENNFVFVWRHF